MKVLVCGDRNYTDYHKIYRTLARLPKDSLIIEGGCRGADRLASKAACELGLRVREYKADWFTYGRAAGPIRNAQMLKRESPELVLAFHSKLDESKGTIHMIKLAERAGIPIRIIC